MKVVTPEDKKINTIVLLLLLFSISALFVAMISQFLVAFFLACIFSALAYPLQLKFENWFGGRRSLAAGATLLVILVAILIPLVGLATIVAAQAIEVGQTVVPWFESLQDDRSKITGLLAKLPFIEQVAQYQQQILEKLGGALTSVSSFLIKNLSTATAGTVNFLLMFFIMLYSMFFLLLDGKALLIKVLHYLPLESKDENRLLDRFTSVTRATIKGTFLIGALQGTLAGIAFAFVGISEAVFWGAMMAVLSVIPSIGSALIWAPASMILIFSGEPVKGWGLLIFCGVVVGSVDNILRPILVGKDAKLHELMILFGTLGGIIMFGMVGIIIGPIIASLFVTVWEIYEIEFREMLPSVTLGTEEDTRSQQDTSAASDTADTDGELSEDLGSSEEQISSEKSTP